MVQASGPSHRTSGPLFPGQIPRIYDLHAKSPSKSPQCTFCVIMTQTRDIREIAPRACIVYRTSLLFSLVHSIRGSYNENQIVFTTVGTVCTGTNDSIVYRVESQHIYYNLRLLEKPHATENILGRKSTNRRGVERGSFAKPRYMLFNRME